MPDLFDSCDDDTRARLLAAGWLEVPYYGETAWRHPNGKDIYQRLDDVLAAEARRQKE